MAHDLTAQEIKWAQDVQKNYGVPASVTLGQYIYESGAGTSNIAKQANNGFGVKGSGDAGTYNGTWAKYSSMEQSFDAYGKLLNKDRYTSKTAGATNSREYLQGVVAGGYCSDPGYVDNVMQIIADNGLSQYDTGITGTGAAASGSGDDSGFWITAAKNVVKVIFILVLVILAVLFVYNAFKG